MSRGGILVTGASSGIGHAIAAELARHDYTVGCVSRRGAKPDGDNLVAFTADVTDEPAVEAALSSLVDQAGSLAGLVNAAGVVIEKPTAELDSELARLHMDTNFIGTLATCRAAFPHLSKEGGTIVNIGSFYERYGVPRVAAYAASKAAIGALTRTLAVEWAKHRIRVLNVAPGYIETELNAEVFEDPELRDRIVKRIPMRRVGSVDEVGRLVRSLFVEDIAFLNGETIYIDGGQLVSM